MKKIILMLLVISMVAAMVGCGTKEEPVAKVEEVKEEVKEEAKEEVKVEIKEETKEEAKEEEPEEVKEEEPEEPEEPEEEPEETPASVFGTTYTLDYSGLELDVVLESIETYSEKFNKYYMIKTTATNNNTSGNYKIGGSYVTGFDSEGNELQFFGFDVEEYLNMQKIVVETGASQEGYLIIRNADKLTGPITIVFNEPNATEGAVELVIDTSELVFE